jgi:hypothetical protein
MFDSDLVRCRSPRPATEIHCEMALGAAGVAPSVPSR